MLFHKTQDNMTSRFDFFKRFFTKPPTPRIGLETLRNGYSNLDAIVDTSKTIYTVGKLGSLGAATAALQCFEHEIDVANKGPPSHFQGCHEVV
ncbi:hypothetical protein L3X38_009564 [Prunus dulcis]|uniref:Uncharacterized protein n=1 Tax=Prunus dulcis TaxID=3755 RepID=A0AAD4WFF9_PRUDU|nr:hypothetical protein L3X38_009564 [Prunus dulcis]